MQKKQILIVFYILVACKSRFEKIERKTFLPINKTESIVNDYSNLFTKEYKSYLITSYKTY